MVRSFGARYRSLRQPDDAGFTLTELVVAMAIFTVFCSAALGLLVRTGDTTRVNLNRTAAANLASQQIQLARALDAVDIPLGTQTSTQTVSGTTYTLKQTSKYLTGDATASVCSGGLSTTLAYKLVTVKVSWPGATSAQVVRQDTLKAVGVKAAGLDSTGVLAVLVKTADATPLPDVPITLNNGSSATTDDSGCAVFVGLSANSYTASLSVLGFVGLNNAQLVQKDSLGVIVGKVSRYDITYDSVRNVVVKVSAPVTGGVIPSGLPIQISSSNISSGLLIGPPACPGSGTPTSACATAPTTSANGKADGLYPAIYTVKLGACTESAPSQNQIDLSSPAANGGIVTVPMGAITINLTKAGVPYGGTKTVTVTHSGVNTGCPLGETYSFPATATGTRILVPFGAWNVTVPTTSAALPTSTQAVTLTPTISSGGTNFTVTS